ncbi:C39 family peptidase [Lyngbya confervoides]|uniref:C39 family peptidase n=1 Tax=Lyngbya confervoides BDU141951 TaxID=1574623 RepID=A0ABD4SYW3_9CYAN|nr:C39 family peptidase [Lyngbya confervoides]MCM1981651.1 C39 family peptidase [Lyngbya confervoides BDU141951]
MDQDILAYQRDRALDWLRNEIKASSEPDELDQHLDALIRRIAGLQNGRLYGFVRLPEAQQREPSSLEPAQIKALRETYIKLKPVASNYLYDQEKVLVPSGTRITVEHANHDKHQHLWIQLPNQRQGFIYAPHWEVSEVLRNQEIKLAVPYYSQRDNWEKFHGPGGRQCNLTAHCMAADYLLKGDLGRRAKEKGYQEAEDLYGEILYRYGDTTNPQAHTPALKDLGIESYFSYTGSIKDLILCLDHDVPVPMGVAYKASGHYVCAVGHKAEGVYIHDPFGIRMGMTDNYENSSGEYDFVTWEWLEAKWVDQGSEAGWMRVMTAVNGTSTGAPTGL